MKKKSQGFTLIELMVVISIIALLSSIVLASLHSSEVSAQDAAREETLHSVANALELYDTANGHYPETTTDGISLQDMVQQDLSPYMPALPTSFSVPNQLDYYVSNQTGTSYELLAATESNGALSSGCSSADYSTYAGTVGNDAACKGTNVTSSIWTPPPPQNPAPTVYLNIVPLSLSPGETATLTWSSTNAGSCELSEDETQIFNGDLGGYLSEPPSTSVSGSIQASINNDNSSGDITVTCFANANLTGLSGYMTITASIGPPIGDN